jgi:hypothetical protein
VDPPPAKEPAPETTQEPLEICDQVCRVAGVSQTCDAYMSTTLRTCAELEDTYNCDCGGCACITTFQSSCKNLCAGTNPDCSCEQSCGTDGQEPCCHDFADECSDFDFSAVESSTTDIVGSVVGVGIVVLVGAVVGGVVLARKALVNSKLAREEELLKHGNVNLDTGVYTAPTLRMSRAVTRGYSSPNSNSNEFGLL